MHGAYETHKNLTNKTNKHTKKTHSSVQITYLPQKSTWEHEWNQVGAFDGLVR